MRSMIRVLVALACAVPLYAQSAPEAATLPDGWSMRLDRPDADAARLSFRAMPPGWHVTSGPAAIFWNPGTAASGSYRASARIHLMRAAEHPEAYGLFVGGRDLAGPDQSYLYFLVRQTGEFTVRHRAGAEVHTLVDWTAHPAIAKGDAAKSVANTLAIEAAPDRVRFLVNDAEVAALERVPHLETDGVVGLRVNHRLDVHVESLTVTPGGR